MFPRFAFGLGYLILLLAVGLLVLGVHFMSGTVPQYSGSAVVSGISGTIDIDRDEYAIPHIHAATERDAYLGLGYAEAQDRLFQMELERRLGAGTMSELFGNRTLVVDEWSRTIGFSRIADQMWLKASPRTRDVLTAFVDGINAYLAAHRKHLGFEFDALQLVPENWRPQDCLAIGRLMSWEMNFSALADAAFGDFSLTLDSAHLRSLFPTYPTDGATVLGGANPAMDVSNYLADVPKVPTAVRASAMHRDTGSKPSNEASKPQLSKAQQVKPVSQKPSPKIGGIIGSTCDFATLFRQACVFDSMIGATVGGGSNAFAISGSRTSGGGAMLENDAHLQLESPSRWYLAHLVSDDGLNVAGFLIPGLPVILSGRTANLAWGITNGMADECDYFIERLDSAGTKYMLPNGTARNFTSLHDTIRVRDSSSINSESDASEAVTHTHAMHRIPLTIRMTIHGSVLSDMHPDGVTQSFQGDARAGGIPDTSIFTNNSRPVSMMWNGTYALSDEIAGFLDLPRAASVAEARKGMASFATPCLNLCLADARGNIAYQYIGRLPRRSGNDSRELLPRDGTSPADQWTGFISMPDLPTVTNPTRGYFVSANNPPMNNSPISFGLNWEPSARSDRIGELLAERPRVDAAYVQSVQTDIISPYNLRRVLPYLLALYPDANPPLLTPDSASALRLDSMRIFWKEDSIFHHTSISDSAMKLVRQKDSLTLAELQPRKDSSKAVPVDPFTAQVLQYLRNWDGGMRADEIAPSIYSVFLNRLLFNTLYDGLGSDERACREHYAEFIALENIPLVTLSNLLTDTANVWWHTSRVIGRPWGRDSVIQLSFHESLRILANIYGPDIRTWQWGRLHTLTFRHPFDKAGPMIARLVDVLAGPMPGGPTTVLQGAYYLWNPYAMQVGPSMRMIADMKDDVLLAVLPTGNSEAIFGDHYRDMLPLYQSGALIRIPLDASYEPGKHWDRFELKPE